MIDSEVKLVESVIKIIDTKNLEIMSFVNKNHNKEYNDLNNKYAKDVSMLKKINKAMKESFLEDLRIIVSKGLSEDYLPSEFKTLIQDMNFKYGFVEQAEKDNE